MQRIYRQAGTDRAWSAGWGRMVLGFCLLNLAGGAVLTAEYQDHAALSAQLRSLTNAHSTLVRVTSQALSQGRREVWLVEVGTGSDTDRRSRPALLVVAGIEGDDLIGTAIGVRWIQHLAHGYATNDAVRRLLDTTTVYLFPRANPDASESYFQRPRAERTVNNTPEDEDHDGLIDEDGPEDLNGDGLITSMRVEDAEGEYILDSKDPRLLLRADKAKGEVGAWKLLREGRDNDQDREWNEDGQGGVLINRNFPYGYQFFGRNAGRHQVSEVESRALADFLVSHPNVAIVLTFGQADNLVQAPKSEAGGKRPPQAISEADAPFYKELGRVYRDVLGLKKELTGASLPGTFSDWAYFHRGRFSLAAQPWTPAMQIELEKSAKPPPGKETPALEDAKAGDTSASAPRPDAKAGQNARPDPKDDKEEKPPPDKRGEEERAALKWATEHAPEAFVSWKPIEHPDFPGQKVEVGGWAPLARNNPPAALIEDLARKHAEFLTTLAGKLPRVGFRKVESRHLGSGVHELTVQVENRGYLPTALAQGALTREVLSTRVVLRVPDDQVLAGQKTRLLGPIQGSGGMEELRYILRATGVVGIEVISALGGSDRRTAELKEAP